MMNLVAAMRAAVAEQMPNGFTLSAAQTEGRNIVMAHESGHFKIRLELVEGRMRQRVNSYLNENEGDDFAASAPLDLPMERAVRSAIQSALIDIEDMCRKAARKTVGFATAGQQPPRGTSLKV